jgi:hypothetical protein
MMGRWLGADKYSHLKFICKVYIDIHSKTGKIFLTRKGIYNEEVFYIYFSYINFCLRR